LIGGNMEKVKINDKEFTFSCISSFDEKVRGGKLPGIKLELNIIDENGVRLIHDTFKNSYVAEKICDFIKNTINGRWTK